MDRCGLIIHFDPYAVDCYAAGMYQVEIPWSELKDLIDPKGPVSLLHLMPKSTLVKGFRHWN